MRLVRALLLPALLCSVIFVATPQTTSDYPLGPDSKPQPGVPKGEVLKLSFDQSKIFPGTARDYWIYVPAQSALSLRRGSGPMRSAACSARLAPMWACVAAIGITR